MRRAMKVAKAARWALSLAFAGVLTGCASPDPVPTPGPIPSPREDDLVGEWQSKTTEDAVLSIHADGTFDIAGFCLLSGRWEIDESEIAAAPVSIPDIGGCAESFVVDREAVSAFVLLDNGELQLVDDTGDRDTFRRIP